MSVRGKVALITGAGTGIGKATTARMRADGAHVIAGIIGEEERTVASDFTQRILDVRLQSDWDAALLTVVNNSVVSISWLTMQDF